MAGWTYMLRCSDNSYYVGSTSHDEVETRVDEHNEGRYPGFTAKRLPVVLVWARHFRLLEDAHATERRLKGWSRAKKEALMANDAEGLEMLARRRGGRPIHTNEPMTAREFMALFNSAGALRQKTHARVTQPKPRHPEVRDPQSRKIKLATSEGAGRAPKDFR